MFRNTNTVIRLSAVLILLLSIVVRDASAQEDPVEGHWQRGGVGDEAALPQYVTYTDIHGSSVGRFGQDHPELAELDTVYWDLWSDEGDVMGIMYGSVVDRSVSIHVEQWGSSYRDYTWVGEGEPQPLRVISTGGMTDASATVEAVFAKALGYCFAEVTSPGGGGPTTKSEARTIEPYPISSYPPITPPVGGKPHVGERTYSGGTVPDGSVRVFAYGHVNLQFTVVKLPAHIPPPLPDPRPEAFKGTGVSWASVDLFAHAIYGDTEFAPPDPPVLP